MSAPLPLHSHESTSIRLDENARDIYPLGSITTATLWFHNETRFQLIFRALTSAFTNKLCWKLDRQSKGGEECVGNEAKRNFARISRWNYFDVLYTVSLRDERELAHLRSLFLSLILFGCLFCCVRKKTLETNRVRCCFSSLESSELRNLIREQEESAFFVCGGIENLKISTTLFFSTSFSSSLFIFQAFDDDASVCASFVSQP